MKKLFYNILGIVLFITLLSCEQNESSEYPRFYAFKQVNVQNVTKYVNNQKIDVIEQEKENVEDKIVMNLFPLEISFMSEEEIVLAYNINGVTNYLNGDFHRITNNNFLLTVDYPVYSQGSRRLHYTCSKKNGKLQLTGYYYSVTNLTNEEFISESGIGYMDEGQINSFLCNENLVFSINFNIVYHESF